MRRWLLRGLAVVLALLIMGGTVALAAHLSQRVQPRKRQTVKRAAPIEVVRKKKPKPKRTRIRRRARTQAPPRAVSLPSLSLPSTIQAPAPVQAALDTRTLHRVALKKERRVGTQARLVFTEDMVDDPPRVIMGGQPRYPFEAQQRGVEGEVTLRLLVSAEGAVTQALVQKSQPSGVFDAAAIRAARRYRFRPARYHGRAVQVWVVKTFKFRLR
jgi:protein TonB